MTSTKNKFAGVARGSKNRDFPPRFSPKIVFSFKSFPDRVQHVMGNSTHRKEKQAVQAQQDENQAMQAYVLKIAARIGDGELLEPQLSEVPLPETDDDTVFHMAALNGEVSVIEALVRLGSHAIDTPNRDGWTALRSAASNGHAPVIETLFRLGSQAIDTPDKYGRTPMYAAASKGHVPVIETLVRLGSMAIDTPSNNG
ncbi:MAG: ankyrin repeat domain-containing protein, partial [Mycobacteriaceae bacterium]|nr:ankyrin repeat domain-containing protein [Mycobacteriaceae bacterium]